MRDERRHRLAPLRRLRQPLLARALPIRGLPLIARSRAWTAGLALALALGCGQEPGEARSDDAHSDDARAQIEASGFSEVRILGREDGVIAFEATKGGQRCSGEARLSRAGEARIASRCEAEGAQEELERACAAGDAEACAEAAAGVRSSSPIDWPKATRFAEHACEHGEPQECVHVGLAHELGDRGVPQDPERARAMYERACEAGNTPACTRLRALP